MWNYLEKQLDLNVFKEEIVECGCADDVPGFTDISTI